MTLWLDHASLTVPDFAEGADLLAERFGMWVARTPGHTDAHGRVMLDRGYIELSEGADDDGLPPLALPRFFLGHPDVPAAIALLREAGLAHAPAVTFHGHDGVWWDGVPEAPAGVPGPVLVQRISPLEIAADWPPARTDPQQGGYIRLAAVCLVTPYVADTVNFYTWLVTMLSGRASRAEAAKAPAGDYAPADQQWELWLPSGGRIVVFDPLRPGRARDLLLLRGPCIAGIELGSVRLLDTQTTFDKAGISYEVVYDARGPVLRVDPEATPGILLSVRGEQPPPMHRPSWTR